MVSVTGCLHLLLIRLDEFDHVLFHIAREDLDVDAVGETGFGQQLLGAIDVLSTLAFPAVRVAAPHRRVARRHTTAGPEHEVGESLAVGGDAQRLAHPCIVVWLLVDTEVDGVPVARWNALHRELRRVAEQRGTLGVDGEHQVDLTGRQRLRGGSGVGDVGHLDAGHLRGAEEVLLVGHEHRRALRVELLHLERTGADGLGAHAVLRALRSHQGAVVGKQHG
jgi:hypothetical protein